MSKVGRYLSGLVIVILSVVFLLSVAFADERFEDNKDGTISDSKTRLVWQQQDDGKKRGWHDATAFCKVLTLAGHKDWRLPNIEELASISDSAKQNPAIETAYFPSTQSSTYWSSSESALYPSLAWAVDFGNGVHGYSNKTYTFYVRCARMGQ